MREIISIHALREEGDRFSKFIVATAICVSIHALRKEGDVAQGKPCQL